LCGGLLVMLVLLELLLVELVIASHRYRRVVRLGLLVFPHCPPRDLS